jgi:DNA-binding response OmpR family regulator
MNKHLLLCDDEIHILRAAEFKLKRAGYDVRIASDGQEGWELARQQVPDLVVTDLQMPRMNGFELAEKLRSIPATVDVPIIMLTAKGFELEQQAIVEQFGIIAVLAKPFSPRELLRMVDETLASHHEQQPVGAVS